MNPELRSYLRLAAPNMPPEVAWPTVDRCKKIEAMAEVPADIRTTINQYLPKGVQISATGDVVTKGTDVPHPLQVLKFNDKHYGPGSKGGQFAPKEGMGGSSSEPVGPVGPGTIDDFTKLPIGERNTAFSKLSREHRDALADPRNSVPARMDELLGEDKDFTDLNEYVKSYSHLLPEDNQKAIIEMMDAVHTDARAAGMNEEDARSLQHALTRAVIAQDYEAASRTLGDHGSFHLRGDMEMSKDILGVLPTNVNTPGNRLLMSVVAATHDMGYLTPPSRNFLDLDHPRWGQQYFDEHFRPQLERTMGKDWASLASVMIGAHDSPNVDWEQHPERSAFSTADNFALFHKEKMPPMLRHVPDNIGVLIRLAEGRVDVASAKELMRVNIDKAEYLSPQLKAAYSHAVSEVSGVLPKFTLGMVGTQYKGVKWNASAGAVEVNMERSKANEGLAKVLDLGQRQFSKLAETYHATSEELISKGSTTFYNPNTHKAVLIAKLTTRKGDFFMALKRNLFG